MNVDSPEPIGRLLAAPEVLQLAQTLSTDRAAAAYGIWGSSAAAVVSGIARQLDRPVLFVCGHLDEADD
ncbi:MAG: hypothetical protein ACTHM6_17940, partial [Tepidisphaeraceae bacterium]